MLDADGSDSAMLDNALEFVVHGGRDVRHALSMLVPPAWEGNRELPQEVRDFYRYHAGLVEPWDGPAGLVFTDGHVVGAALDRNGLRPLRYAVCEDGLVVCSSEAGAVSLDGHGLVRRGKLGPGQMIAVDPERGFEEDDAIKRRLAGERPYGIWLEEGIVAGSTGAPVEPPEEDLTPRQALHGYTREELMQFLRPIASHAHDPTYSMGDDTALAPLAGRARPLYHYFKQRFAQVTNPPIDHLRERFVMSLRTVLGSRAPLLSEGPEVAAGIELDSFFLFPDALEQFQAVRLDATFDPAEGLEAACERLAADAEAAVRAGAGMLLVSDTTPGRAPIPALLATGTVHHRLVAGQLRTKATLVVETDEAREVHHFACLLGYGAEAVCPRLALETLAAMAAADKIGGDRPSPAEAQLRFKQAIEDGVLKVMSKMGISDVASYCGAQIFDAVGLAREVVDRAFVGTPCPIGGIGFAELEREIRERFEAATAAKPAAREPGLRQVAQGRRAARDERRRRRRAPRARRCARSAEGGAQRQRLRSRRLGALRAVRRARQRAAADGAARPARARPGGPAGSARRGRASRGDPAPVLRAERCRTARSRRRRTRRSRSRSTASAARRTRARAARIRPASGTSATARSSRSRRAASASRRSTRRSRKSSRSRSPRARSPARAVSCPATRSRARSRGCDTRRRASR